jgi:excisionase family DNA binding protein
MGLIKMSELEPLAVSINEAARLIGISRGSVYGAIARGELEAVKDGGKTKIIYASLKRREASLPPAQIKRRPR